MKASRKSVLALIGAMAVGVAVAAPSVEIVSVQQQYPWTNTVDIVYNVAGVASETNGYFVAFTPTTQAGQPIEDINGETSIQVALTCTTNGAVAQWFPQTNQQYTACKMTPSVFRGGSGGGNDYMIVDLETGAVTYEPMATQEASNERYQADAYKTRYLVLRRIPAGDDYVIGGTRATVNDKYANTQHTVKMPKDYYAGIYMLTVAQYNRMAGISNPGTSKIPVSTVNGGVTWNTMRGAALSQAVPSSGPLKKLYDKTGLMGFDLPTCSMWEVAARAGVTTSFLWGDSLNALARGNYEWWHGNSGDKAQEVGLKNPNAWGLYDIHGNGQEWTLDWRISADLATLQPDGQVPVTTGVSTYRMTKSCGYDWTDGASLQGSYNQNTPASGISGSAIGYRIFYLER